MTKSDIKFSVAPMMECTDRHCRFFLRLLTRRARLYTEMIVAEALLHGNHARLLAFDESEHPLACQLGGSDSERLARAARIVADHGYDEINLNVGCPSDRVREGRFGVCLMAEPALVARSVEAMMKAVDIPISVKCRVGIDDQDSRQSLFSFVDAIATVGCTHFVVHARKAWLKGLSPKDNRNIPPLEYDVVRELKARRPDLVIVLNGGIASLDQAEDHLTTFNGVMLGRAVYERPWLVHETDERIFGEARSNLTRHDVIERLMPYVEREMALGTPLHAITRHILGLFHGEPGARAFRRHLSTYAVRQGAGPQVLKDALAAMTAPVSSFAA